MPTDIKQLTADEVLDCLKAINPFSEAHEDEWRNQVARDLNHIIGHAEWNSETDDDQVAVDFGNAVIRIVERVAEFENIEAKRKPNV